MSSDSISVGPADACSPGVASLPPLKAVGNCVFLKPSSRHPSDKTASFLREVGRAPLAGLFQTGLNMGLGGPLAVRVRRIQGTVRARVFAQGSLQCGFPEAGYVFLRLAEREACEWGPCSRVK